ncbi:MAG: FAD-dependent oxidoreductase, partial [Proteobacteria bacterium]|nr:FAD-dependent oxidoreductase [Pseudomonadota bacterium]
MPVTDNTSASRQHQHDVLIIGSGAAGLSLALHLPAHYRIALISKADLKQGSTYWAQGGMAAVLHTRDTIDSHVEDTLNAGDGLCHRDAVEFTVRNSRRCVEWLVRQGVDFDLREDRVDNSGPEFHLTMEGGHSHRRIIHAADATGRAISEVLIEKAQAAENIEIFTHRVAVDLITAQGHCQGAYILDRQTDHVELFQARAVVLATGGASKV